MSLETKVNGFTTWANLRFQLVGHDIVENVVLEFMLGYNLKILVESLTGRTLRRLKTFEGLPAIQKETRMQWVVDELKNCKIIDEDVKVDCRLVTYGISDKILDLLWYLVCFDIEFIWLRSDYLRQNDIEKLIKCPFSCIPPSPVNSRTNRESTKIINEVTSKEASLNRDIDMVSKSKLEKLTPPPLGCILELINKHLKMTRDGKKLGNISTFFDLDVRVMCALVNSIVEDTFIPQVLLNDRWTMILILDTINGILRFSCQFTFDDLIEADTKSLCCYFAFFFMAGYYLRQSRAAVKRLDFLLDTCLRYQEELSNCPSATPSIDLQKKKELIRQYNLEMSLIKANYDIDDCRVWVRHVLAAQRKAWLSISTAMKIKYEIIRIPMNLTIKELQKELFINLDLTVSYGFYELTCREMITKERKIIIQHKESGKFYDDSRMHDGKKQRSARGALGLSSANRQDINPKNYREFTVFLETLSSNKILKSGSLFLYQIFPGDFLPSQNLLFNIIKCGDLDAVINLVSFFQSDSSFVSGSYGNAKNTPLHLACKLGKFDIVLYLLEQNALLNIQNISGNTALHLAVDGVKRDVCQLLIEWGADASIRNKNKFTPFDNIKSEEFHAYLEDLYEYWQETTPKLANGEPDLLKDIIQIHQNTSKHLSTLRSRCVRGSTLLHVASCHGAVDIIIQLLSMGMDINIRDHKFATPLHKASLPEVVEMLIKHGGDIFLTDCDGNTPLHSFCDGNSKKASDNKCIHIFVSKGIGLTEKNGNGLMAIHFAAMHGKIDAIQTLAQLDSDQFMKNMLNSEAGVSLLPSVVYLAIANGHLESASWLLINGFHMKEGEASRLVQEILMEKVHCSNSKSTIKFLLENGASLNALYSGGNSFLHLTATSIKMLDMLKEFIEYECDINQPNDDHWSPLFFATNSNNYQAAAILLKHGADINMKNISGFTAFDYIVEYDHWINCGLFDDFVVETLKAYSLKKTRELVRSISEKIKKADMNMLN